MKHLRRSLAMMLALAMLSLPVLAECAPVDPEVAALPETELTLSASEATPTAEPEPTPDAPEETAPEQTAPIQAAPGDAETAEGAGEEGGEADEVPALPLNAQALTLGKGESFTLALAGDEAVALSFASSAKKIVTVSAAGVVKAVRTGKAVVTVMGEDGRQAECPVTVVKAPTSIKLSAKALTLGYDAERQAGTQAVLTATLSKGSASRLSYTGYDKSVLSVAADGTVTALGTGVTTITVKTFNRRKATCKVTVLSAPESIAVDAESLTLLERQTHRLGAVLPKNTMSDITFSSDRPDIADVDAHTGLITALLMGEARITATSGNGKTAQCAVTVMPGPDSVALNATVLTLGKGESFTLTAVPTRQDGLATTEAVSFSSSARKVATVTSGGVVKGVKTGGAIVTVAAPNGVSAECAVSVVKAPSSLKLNAESVALEYTSETGVGSQFQLIHTLSKGSASHVTYSGYDPAVVSVSDSGLITAAGFGTTTVTVKTFNKRKATCKITVGFSDEERANYRAAHPLYAVAHRGGRAYWPENTLEAFERAAGTGVDAVELDVQTTKDGVQVIHHNKSFTVGVKKYTISRCTYAELKKAKPSLCTLDEAYKLLCETSLEVQLELKESATTKKCVEIVKKYGMEDRTYYISFFPERLTEVRKLVGDSARLGFIFDTKLPKDLNKTIEALKPYSLMVQQDLLTQQRLDNWHAMGLRVNAWTVNDRAAMARFKAMGVDIITSDYPDYVAQAK